MADASTTQLALIRQLKFCAGHRLYRHESKCAFFHGHNYRVDLEVVAAKGGDEVDEVGVSHPAVDHEALKVEFLARRGQGRRVGHLAEALAELRSRLEQRRRVPAGYDCRCSRSSRTTHRAS